MTARTPRPVAAPDVSVEALLADMSRPGCSPDERMALQESVFLVTHPEAHVSTDADYSWWTSAMGCVPTPGRAVTR